MGTTDICYLISLLAIGAGWLWVRARPPTKESAGGHIIPYIPFDPEKDILVLQTDHVLTEAQRGRIVACWKQATSEGRLRPGIIVLEKMQVVVLGRGKEATDAPTFKLFFKPPENPVS